jgi:hypothetical protein
MAEEPHLKGDEHAWVGMKKIAPDAKEFEANGRRYRVVSSLTVSRYEDFELFQLEVGIGRSFEAIQQSINHAYRLCNRVVKGEEVFAELAILLRDMSIGASLAGTHTPHAVLKMCALFLVRDEEDLSRCPNELIEDKINDWREAGSTVESHILTEPELWWFAPGPWKRGEELRPVTVEALAGTVGIVEGLLSARVTTP